jgi:hypothetical protein
MMGRILTTRPRGAVRWRPDSRPRALSTLARLAPAIAAVLALCTAPAQAAGEPAPLLLDTLVRDADIVFEGTVLAVEFRNALAQSGKRGVPHTFVTWQIHRIFKGRTPGPTMAARFLGGMPNADELLALSRSPRPDVGDRDIVFLRENGESICPLVHCEDGRLRILDAAVYDERGRAFSLRPGGIVQLGATHPGEAFSRWEAAGVGRVRGEEDGGIDSARGTTLSDTTPAGAAMSVSGLRNLLQERVAALYTPAQLARLRPVKSLDPERSFRFRAPRAVPAPRLSDEDAGELPIAGTPNPAETTAFLAGGKNPVIPR